MSASDSAFAIAMLCFIAACLVGDSHIMDSMFLSSFFGSLISSAEVWKAVGTFWIAVHLVRKWKEAF